MHQTMLAVDVDVRHEFPDRHDVYEDGYVTVAAVAFDDQPALLVDKRRLAVYFARVREDTALAPTLLSVLTFATIAERDAYLVALRQELMAADTQYRHLEADEKSRQLADLRRKIAHLDAAHRVARYPPGYRREIGDCDLVLLDAAIYGCVSTFDSRDGHLDLWRTASLGAHYGALMQVLPAITHPDAQLYFQRLAQLALLVLHAVGMQAAPNEDEY